jgi:hypothetical protein
MKSSSMNVRITVAVSAVIALSTLSAYRHHLRDSVAADQNMLLTAVVNHIDADLEEARRLLVENAKSIPRGSSGLREA